MMINRKLIILLSVTGSMAFSSLLLAAHTDEAASAADAARAAEEATLAAEEATLQARLATEYKRALAEADRSRAAAAKSVEKAREQLHLAAEQRERQTERSVEFSAMREELNRTHQHLRESSRAVARVNRDLARARMTAGSNGFVFSTGDRPVLGVILGDTNDVGIKVLGVSPDGPAERAGIAAGDVIVALGGRVLSAVDETGNIRKGLNIALKDIKAEEPVIVSVERGNDSLDLSVVPEVREPLSWQSIVRFPSAPLALADVDEVVMIERIVVPEIDTEALAEQIEQMRIEIDERRVFIESMGDAPKVAHFEFQFDDLSELGDFALHDTNAWFGMPLASGLRLAEIDPALGEYFKTDRGVLILKAKEDNALLLRSGDVVLSLHGTEVNSPAEFMRALRDFEPGDELVIDIKRNRKSKTLKPVIEESQARFFAPDDHEIHQITITTDSN
jgi:C-terminal processing protease CtpA/Prc